LVSSPSFSPDDVRSDAEWQRIVTSTDEAYLFNRAIGGMYPPGSLMKLMITAEALERKKTPHYISGANGFMPLGAVKPVRENEYAVYKAHGKLWTGYGKLDLAAALQKSSNVYFAQLSLELGSLAIMRRAKQFGFNTKIRWNSSNDDLDSFYAISASEFPDSVQLTPEELCWSGLG